MKGKKGPAPKALRNATMWWARQRGLSYVVIGRSFGVSPQRAEYIVKRESTTHRAGTIQEKK